MIDDEELIEELKKYDDHIAIPSSQGKGKKGAASGALLSDRNREIYMKKLNHYKAREKAESNPSKQYLKQKQQQQHLDTTTGGATIVKTTLLTSPATRRQDGHEEEDDDVIDITDSKNDGSGYYVQMANAQTSPLSTTRYDNDDVIYQSTVSPPPPQPAPLREMNYVSLKDKIELEKTLSKFRSDINNILNDSKVSNRFASVSPSSSRRQNDENTEPNSDHYCPKPAKSSSSSGRSNRSIFDVFKPSTYLRASDSEPVRELTPTHRRGLNGASTSVKASGTAEPEYLIPVKESGNSALSGFYQNQLKPFVTNFGLQISRLLPYLVIVIFTIIILQYARMKLQSMPGEAGTGAGDSLYSGEGWFAPKTVQSNFCPDIKDPKCSQTKLVLRELIDYLRARSGVVDCAVAGATTPSTSDGRLSMSFVEKCVHVNELVDLLVNKRGLVPKKLQSEAVDSVLRALLRNPNWDIHLLNETYAETNTPADAVYLMSTISSKPVMCRLRETLQLLYIRGLMIASAVLVIGLAYLAITLYNRQRNEKNQVFYSLVSQVVAMVEQQYNNSLHDSTGNTKPYVAIAHIYDTLVEPSQRAKQKPLWNKVIKFIADHESRIHLETQFIEGEEIHVWKWILPRQDTSLHVPAHTSFKYPGIGLANSTMIHPDTPFHGQLMHQNDENAEATPIPNIYPPLPQLVSPSGWQGDAFSKSDRSLYSPTPCLKIRNMFDQVQIEQDPHFAAKIHNAILEKCCMNAPNSLILHIACDRKSKEGCVYVKCANNEAAGRAYLALNGTWYNGKLLNVKYLRSDRYLERFPESIAFTSPVQRL